MTSITQLLKELKDSEHTNFGSGTDSEIDIDNYNLTDQLQKFKNHRYLSDTKSRGWLAIWSASVVTLWLGLVILILRYNEAWLICLNDNVLITLLGTTTLNVLGLSFIVLRGHFDNK